MDTEKINSIKMRFGIIGNDPEYNRALDTAMQVAGTDLSVLVTGESGAGKEFIPQVIHASSARKHNKYIAVNCGAIPEGTIDSELFGHMKGSFTGAIENRKGYFEEADGGTLFLDEVAELPLPTQARLLRVLQSGEFIRVGSATVQKTNVRVIAATNVNLPKAIEAGKFREDLYYRLNVVPIHVPSLKERKGDIALLFMKFAQDFSDKYMIPCIHLTPEAKTMLESYGWPGNVRQLKSVAEQISALEKNRTIDASVLHRYLPQDHSNAIPATTGSAGSPDYLTDRDIIFKILVQMRNEIDALKKMVGVAEHVENMPVPAAAHHDIREESPEIEDQAYEPGTPSAPAEPETPVSLDRRERERADIISALKQTGGRRKDAADLLGLSERTLYRKIKTYGLDE